LEELLEGGSDQARWQKLGGEQLAAQSGEHVGQRRGALGVVPGGACPAGGDVGGGLAVLGVPADHQAQAPQPERDGPLDRRRGAVACLPDAHDLPALFEADLHAPPVGVPFDQLGGVVARSVETTASS
jgi:hypothetical protein